MEDISKLIREARPLYFERRKRRRAMAFCTAIAICVLAVNLNLNWHAPATFYDVWTEQIYVTENGSPIEELGLPVDEYGFLLVG